MKDRPSALSCPGETARVPGACALEGDGTELPRPHGCALLAAQEELGEDPPLLEVRGARLDQIGSDWMRLR